MNNNNIPSYFKGLDHKLLTAEEERELAERVLLGDEDAREQLVLHNLRLVVHLAQRYKGKGVDLEDIIQQGNYGLMVAVDKYDPSKGRFTTYATYWILAEISYLFDNHTRPFKVGLHTARATKKIYSLEQKFLYEHQRLPSPEELLEMPEIIQLAKKLKKSPEELLLLRQLDQSIVRLDSEISEYDGNNSKTLLEFVPDTVTEPIDKVVARNDLVDYLLRGLSDSDQLIIRLYFGLGDEKSHTLREIAEKLGVREQRVQQLKATILEALKEKALTDPELSDLDYF